VQSAIAEDWLAELDGLPAWAIQKACRWWMGSENANRHRKPMPGDIAAVARDKASILGIAERRIASSRFRVVGSDWRYRPEPVSPEDAAEILKNAGYTPRKFGGE